MSISLSSLSAEIKPQFTLRMKEYPSPSYAHREFDKLWLDLPELRGIFSSPGDSKLTPDCLGFQ